MQNNRELIKRFEINRLDFAYQNTNCYSTSQWPAWSQLELFLRCLKLHSPLMICILNVYALLCCFPWKRMAILHI